MMEQLKAHLVSVSPDLIVVQVPEEASSGDLWISLNGQQSGKVSCEIATPFGANLHPVANPALVNTAPFGDGWYRDHFVHGRRVLPA
jgi:hypothetical protein